jgi:dihydrofolate reductase
VPQAIVVHDVQQAERPGRSCDRDVAVKVATDGPYAEAKDLVLGKDMIVFGSGSIASQLTQHGLIDEYQFVVSPILLGSGRPLLSGVSNSLKLDLLEAKKYQSGNVMLRYARPN